MTNTPSAEKHPSQPEPDTPRMNFESTTIGNLDAIADSSTTDPGQVLRDEEASGCRDQLRESSSSGSLSKNEDMIITSIRATDVTLGLRRLPAGFYVLLHHEGLQWRTEIKPASVDADVVEWSTLTAISSSMLATICLEVYASFEFHPVLGSGERLRKITFEVKQLWEHSERDFTFSFLPEDGDVVSPCSSILVTIKRQRRQSDGPSVFGALGSPWSTPESQDEIAEATDSGHCALTRYRKHGGKHDLECAISQFEHAVDICPPDHPCRAAVQSNLATAKLILCQVGDTDAFLKEALRLYCDALAARPTSHPDRPSTLIHLAVVYFTQFQKKGDLVERTMADGLLDQALELIPAQSHQNQAVIFLRQLHATRMIPGKPTVESVMEPDLTPHLTDEDPLALSGQLLDRYAQFDDVTALHQAITVLQALIKSMSISAKMYYVAHARLGTALLLRFRHLGELADIDSEDALSRLRDSIGLMPDNDPGKPDHLNNLGISLQTRFKHLGQLNDLVDAISTFRNAVQLSADGHPNKQTFLMNLGDCSASRFGRVGQLSDLEDTISILKDALDLTPHDHPDRPRVLHLLGNSLIHRFERLGQLSDLEDAISWHRDAVRLTPDGRFTASARLNSLAISLITPSANQPFSHTAKI